MTNESVTCDVKACKYHAGENRCTLPCITVTNTHDCKTAHFCGDYCECADCKGS